MKPSVFLDRDGVIVREIGFITRVDQVELLPGAAEGMAALRKAGFALVVATNQSAIARGLLTEATLKDIHAEIAHRLKAAHPEAAWDALYRCPHHPTEGPAPQVCECRKPKPGMLLQAAADLGLDLARSWMVGDSERDVGAGRAAGCRTIALPGADGAFAQGADRQASSLLEAAALLAAP